MEKSDHKGRQPERKKGRKELQSSQKTINKMAIVSSYFSVITSNVNGLSSPVKRYKVAEWIKNTRQNYILSTRDSNFNGTYRKVKDRKIYSRVM